ncbi:MAG TPA: penicillin-binding transpeptidase domain-containing protein [Solirubrobacteraceae bacterium]|jgi:peptidoglycan glycosyltransferase
MSAQITKLFGLVVVLFALLIVFTTRWTVIDKTKLDNNALNHLTLIQELKIRRGRILADDGTVLARSVPAGGGTWARTYPTGPLFSQAVGYSNLSQGEAAGLELSDGNYTRGIQTGLNSVFGQLTPRRVGDDVITTLDPKAQQAAVQGLAGQVGSVVALNPQTGAVKAMYSNPSYNDNNPTSSCLPPSCSLVNRATQSNYPPGSTFKIVTSTAAIDSGQYTPSSTVNGNSPVTISGVPLSNDGNQSWGPVDLTTALTYSINTVWAQVAEHLGRGTMTDYMKRFGFYSKPPLDLPPGELNVSQPFSPAGHPYPPGSPNEDIGRIGIGEGGLQVTPIQMAMVAAAVANGGKLMVPHLTARVVDSTGVTVKTISPAVYNQVMKPSTAAALAQMMKKVVDEGTGTAAQLGNISVAGKTGTAQVGVQGSGLTQPWFIGFAPIENPKVAVAVTVERSQGGFGGTVAAPIARNVIETLLSEGQ